MKKVLILLVMLVSITFSNPLMEGHYYRVDAEVTQSVYGGVGAVDKMYFRLHGNKLVKCSSDGRLTTWISDEPIESTIISEDGKNILHTTYQECTGSWSSIRTMSISYTSSGCVINIVDNKTESSGELLVTKWASRRFVYMGEF